LARLLIRSGGTDPTGSNVAQFTDAGSVAGGKVGAARQYDLPAAAGGKANSAARRAARRWALLVAAGWLVEFGLRVWFSRGQSVPLANPDESAYLIAGRVLAGGPTTDFSYSTLYQAGYPLLIAPVY
jgi:hypothetical protein